MPRTLGGDHDDVEILAWGDLAEMDVEPVGKGERRALLDVGRNLVAVEGSLVLVWGEDHDDVGALHRLLDRTHLETRVRGLGRRGRAGPQANHHRDAGILQIVGMGMAL